jgi:hypothetical protein
MDRKKPQKKDRVMNALPKEERYCPVSESLKESLKEVKLIREGKMKAITWDEYLKEQKKKKDK